MWADRALERFLDSQDVMRVLDIGSGSGVHAEHMRSRGKDVTTISLVPPADIVGNYMEFDATHYFDGIWASHVLEHQPDPGAFLRKCFSELRPDGLFAVTVPPEKDEVVGGHLTHWNLGLLAYNLIVAGFDCSEARCAEYGYNLSILVRKKPRPFHLELFYDAGDVEKLSRYFPWPGIGEGFNGRQGNIRW